MPRARRELRHWEERARAIDDPVLREHALTTLQQEAMNSEAAAVFAVLVPRRSRASTIRLLVAFQVMYDFLDTIGEEQVADPLANGLALYRALDAALDPSALGGDYYHHHPQRDASGYLDALVTACRGCLDALPAGAVVLPLARHAARRCGEAQSHTHATVVDGTRRLAAWSCDQDRSAAYLWWEVAAAGISSVGVHALLAAAADPCTTRVDAAALDAAYFPSACALSTLLDSLIDRDRDALTADHGFVSYYATRAIVAERLATIARHADAAVRHLRHGRRHAVILAGIAGYYLSDAGAASDYARPIAAALVLRMGPAVPMVLATVRLRRRFEHRPSS